jgi:tetratricopeptide (TPR) repeat protein
MIRLQPSHFTMTKSTSRAFLQIGFIILLVFIGLWWVLSKKPDTTTIAEQAAVAKPGSKPIPADEKDWEKYTRQADDLAANDQLPDAVAMYDEALKAKADHPAAHANLAAVLLRLEKSGEAKEHLEAALKSDPNLTSAQVNLALLMLDQGQQSDALILLERALEHAPEVPEVHRNLGLIYFDTRQFTKAVEHYSKLTQILPQDATAFLSLGLAQIENGELEPAVANLQKSTELPDPPARAFTNLARVLALTPNNELRDLDKAISLAERAVAVAEKANLPATLRILALTQAAKRDFETAILTIKRAITTAEEAKDDAAAQRLLLDQIDLEGGQLLR